MALTSRSSQRPCRAVEGLREASLHLGPSPWPKARLKGVARVGLAYQRQVAKALAMHVAAGSALVEPWFRFTDANGSGFCSPDALVAQAGGILVVEVKLTFVPEADRQLDRLYRPVVAMAYGLPLDAVRGLIVCRGLTMDTPVQRVIHSLVPCRRAAA